MYTNEYLHYSDQILFHAVAAPNPHILVKRDDVQQALIADEGPSAKLISFEMKDFTTRGDNYACVVSSVELTFEKEGREQQKSFVVKLNPLRPLPVMEKMAEVLFSKEISFYKEIVPLLNKELDKLQLKPLKMPKYFHSVARKKEEVIFLEDMRKRGFKMLDRKIGMDRNHTMLIMKELARLHAISAVLMNTEEFKGDNLMKKFPFLEEAFEKMMEGADTSVTDNWFGQGMSTAAEIAEMNKDYEYAGRFLRSLVPNISKIVLDCLKAEEPFITICHGDCWNNNFLFR